MKKYFTRISLLLILFSACASQRAPSGGPEDKMPPEIIKTIPTSGAVKVPLNTQIVLEYSESIDRDTFPDALFISPDPGEYKVKQKRKRTILHFEKPFLLDRTYAITLGTNLRDVHNVSLDKSFTFAFSTGDSIDQGEISGRVFDSKAQGVVIWAYILNDNLQIDPRQTGGDYATQVGKDGRFSIPFMADGMYRLFAVEDAGKTGVYNPVEDRIAMADRDIKLRGGNRKAKNLAFRLMRQDTLGPTVTSVGMRNQSSVEIRFDEAVIAADSNWVAHFSLIDTVKKEPVPILRVARFPLDPRRFDLMTQPLSQATVLRFSCEKIMDLHGNENDSTYSFYDFFASTEADTMAPRVLQIWPEDKSRHISRDSTIHIIFNEWMDTTVVKTLVSLTDTNGTKFTGHSAWENPFSYQFRADSLLPASTLIKIGLQKKGFMDFAGNTLFDTSATRLFTTINPDTLSSIAGSLQDDRALADSSAIYFLRAQQTGRSSLSYTTGVRNRQNYLFESMLPGSYIIDGFIDKNGDGKYSYGTPLPFQSAEYYFQYADTIKIRSRWPNEGEDIILTD